MSIFATNRTTLPSPSPLVLWDIGHTMIDTGGVGCDAYATPFHTATGIRSKLAVRGFRPSAMVGAWIDSARRAPDAAVAGCLQDGAGEDVTLVRHAERGNPPAFQVPVSLVILWEPTRRRLGLGSGRRRCGAPPGPAGKAVQHAEPSAGHRLQRHHPLVHPPRRSPQRQDVRLAPMRPPGGVLRRTPPPSQRRRR